MGRQSIYEYMAEQMQGDAMPEGFSLPAEAEGEAGGLRWADGAADGVYIYHMQHSPLEAGEMQEAIEAVRLASGYDVENADRAFETFTAKHNTISFADQLLGWIMEHAAELDAGSIYRYGIHLMIESPYREMVKLGLILMELFDTNVEVLGDVVRSLGLSDEFTLYSVLNLQRWPNGSEEIFDLIRRVRGWGRIHALEHLEPETKEIQDWILKEGMDNEVMEAYSALTAFQKGAAEVRLRLGASPEELKSIGKILNVLLEEGPVEGISGLSNAEEILCLFLRQLKPEMLGLEECRLAQQLYYYTAGRLQAMEKNADNTTDRTPEEGNELPAENGAEAEAVKNALAEASRLAVELLRAPETEKLVREALQEGRGVELAAALGIPYQKDLLRLMKDDFDKNSGLCAWLMESPAYAEAVLDLYRRNIDLETLGENAENADKEEKSWMQLQQLLMAMGGDCRTAGDILLKTLGAPSEGCRYYTLECLKAWTEKAGEPLQKLSARIYNKLEECAGRETDAEMKETMQKLLGGN